MRMSVYDRPWSTILPSSLPSEVIAHAEWLSFRILPSLRMVADLLAAREIIVRHQAVRLWAAKFGRTFANDIRRRSSGRLGTSGIWMKPLLLESEV